MQPSEATDNPSPESAPPGARARTGAPAASRPYYVLGILCTVYGLNFLDRQVLNILIDPIEAAFHTTDAEMGLLTGFGFAIFYLLFGIPIARWADRGSRKLILTLGLGIWSLMTAISGLAQGFWQLAAARVGVAIGETGGTPISHSLISDYFPRTTRARAMAIFETSVYVGVLLGYAIGGWVSQVYGWRAAFFVAGIPGLCVAFVVFFTVREPERGASDSRLTDRAQSSLIECLRFMSGQRALLLVVTGVVLNAFANFGFATWSPSFLHRVHGMDQAQIGLSLGLINGTAGVLGTLLGGFVVGRLPPGRERWHVLWPAFVTLGASPALIGFLLARPDWLCLACYWVANLLLGFHLGPCFAMVQSLSKVRMRSLASALANLLCSLIGAGLAPALIGMTDDLLHPRFGIFSVRYSLLLATLAPLLAAASFWSAAWFIRDDLGHTETADDTAEACASRDGRQPG
jgi:predicted MFS family arabinose efflux permease